MSSSYSAAFEQDFKGRDGLEAKKDHNLVNEQTNYKGQLDTFFRTYDQTDKRSKFGVPRYRIRLP
jgi:hypothetical protein